MVFSCKIFHTRENWGCKRGLLSAGEGSQTPNRAGALQIPSRSRGKDHPVSALRCPSCFHRQGAGSLRHGPQPLRHAGPGLPDDPQEHDGGGCHWAGGKAPLHHAKQGLPEAAERAGHRAGTAKEEQQEQPSTCWAAEQHHHLALPWHGCAAGKETP